MLSLLTRFRGNAPALPAGLLPPPAPLPGLRTAFSRRAAIFGAAASTGALAGSAALALAPSGRTAADARLIELAAEMTAACRDGDDAMAAQPNGTWGEDVPAWTAACESFNAALVELCGTPAAGPAGVAAKARALRTPWAADCADTAADVGAKRGTERQHMSDTDRRQAEDAWKAKAKRDGLIIVMEEDGSMREMGGSRYGVFNHALVDEVTRTAWVTADPGEKEAADRKTMGMVVAAMRAFDPKDEIEGMLAAQATAMHLASMEAFRRAILPQQGAEVASKLRRDGTNLARGMTDMLTALAKHRGREQQKVVVEHVHVHAGGQAVVGAVTTNGALPPVGADVLALAGSDGASGLDDAILVEAATGNERGSR